LAGYIPEDKISEVRNSADIVEVVSEVVRLKKTGKNHLGLCPFHSEKTPSFPDKQIFHCFGCGVGGNIFSFLMKQEGITFPEAVRSLARRYGIEIPERKLSPGQRRRLSERENLLTINRLALDFFRHSLHELPAGKGARDYLAKRRIKPEVVDDFQVGYAPKGWDNVLNYLIKKGHRPALIEKCGLVVARKNAGGYYDRFRDRVIFPIFALSSQVIGFGGRVLDDSLPKYLNSPETALYNKSRSLYGLNLAKQHCRAHESVYVVEGYLDLIALYQHGFRNAVATLGTSLTPEHVRLLRGSIGDKGKVILVYDSDEAGIKAAKRSIAVFDKGFVNAQILILKTGYDPDSYLFEFGADDFRKAADRSLGIISFLLEFAINKYGLSIEGKVRIISELQDALISVGDNIERSLYIKEIAERLDIDETAIREKLRKVSTSQEKKSFPAAAGAPDAGTMMVGRGRSATADRVDRGTRLERQILAMMLQFPVILTEIRKLNVLDYLESNTLRSIGEVILNHFMPEQDSHAVSDADPGDPQRGRIAELLDEIEDEHKRQLITELTNKDESWTIAGCSKLIRHFVETGRKRVGTKDIEDQIKDAELKKDHRLLEKLLIEKQNMAVQRNKQRMAILNILD
jgi:DNA primase